ncbi:MAG: UPF0175 family protein [Promethearchaeia archaeon]
MANKLSIIIPEELKKELDYLKDYFNEDQSSLVRRLIRIGIKSEKLKIAFKLYIDGKISLGRAAELADISIWEMIDLIHDRNIALKYKLSETREEIDKILKKYE